MHMSTTLVGILGGVGPMATVKFMEMLLDMTKADRDQDHMDMLVSNHATIPDRTDFILGKCKESPVEPMIHDAKMLEDAGCHFIVLPCNTAHYFYNKIQSEIHIPLLNIIEETVVYCAGHIPGIQTIGVLATEGTIVSNTYQIVCRRHGLHCVYPDKDHQKKVSKIIYDQVKAGKPVEEQELVEIFRYMRSLGCDAMVLGCTELSVAFKDLALAFKNPDVVDSLTVLAKRTIQFAGKQLMI